jgi:hypothetical protein
MLLLLDSTLLEAILDDASLVTSVTILLEELLLEVELSLLLLSIELSRLLLSKLLELVLVA